MVANPEEPAIAEDLAREQPESAKKAETLPEVVAETEQGAVTALDETLGRDVAAHAEAAQRLGEELPANATAAVEELYDNNVAPAEEQLRAVLDAALPGQPPEQVAEVVAATQTAAEQPPEETPTEPKPPTIADVRPPATEDFSPDEQKWFAGNRLAFGGAVDGVRPPTELPVSAQAVAAEAGPPTPEQPHSPEQEALRAMRIEQFKLVEELRGLLGRVREFQPFLNELPADDALRNSALVDQFRDGKQLVDLRTIYDAKARIKKRTRTKVDSSTYNTAESFFRKRAARAEAAAQPETDAEQATRILKEKYTGQNTSAVDKIVALPGILHRAITGVVSVALDVPGVAIKAPLVLGTRAAMSVHDRMRGDPDSRKFFNVGFGDVGGYLGKLADIQRVEDIQNELNALHNRTAELQQRQADIKAAVTKLSPEEQAAARTAQKQDRLHERLFQAVVSVAQANGETDWQVQLLKREQPLASLFEQQPDGSYRFTGPDMPDSMKAAGADTISAADATAAEREATYAVDFNATLRGTMKEYVLRAYPKNEALKRAVLADNFTVDLGQDGRLIGQAVVAEWSENDSGMRTIIPEPEFCQRVMTALADGKVDATTKALNPDVLQRVLKGVRPRLEVAPPLPTGEITSDDEAEEPVVTQAQPEAVETTPVEPKVPIEAASAAVVVAVEAMGKTASVHEQLRAASQFIADHKTGHKTGGSLIARFDHHDNLVIGFQAVGGINNDQRITIEHGVFSSTIKPRLEAGVITALELLPNRIADRAPAEEAATEQAA